MIIITARQKKSTNLYHHHIHHHYRHHYYQRRLQLPLKYSTLFSCSIPDRTLTPLSDRSQLARVLIPSGVPYSVGSITKRLEKAHNTTIKKEMIECDQPFCVRTVI
jgi:hypothetical protein